MSTTRTRRSTCWSRRSHTRAISSRPRPTVRRTTGDDVALDEIYKEVILDHYKNPRNKRDLPGAEGSCTRHNPLCGDEITVFAHVDDGTVAELTFQGAGCSISQSSASMMTEPAAGKTVDETLELAGQVRGVMAGEGDPRGDRVRDPRVPQG